MLTVKQYNYYNECINNESYKSIKQRDFYVKNVKDIDIKSLKVHKELPFSLSDFYKKGWGGDDRLRRCELEKISKNFKLSYNNDNSNKDIFDKIDKFLNSLVLLV